MLYYQEILLNKVTTSNFSRVVTWERQEIRPAMSEIVL